MSFTALFFATAHGSRQASGRQPKLTNIRQQFGIEPKFVLMQFISFAVLAVVLYWFGIRPLLATMDDRQRKIEEGLKFADDIKVKLAEAEKAAEATIAKAAAAAAATLKEARATAEARIAASTQEAIAAAAAVRKKGEDDLALERAKMLAEVRSEVARLVVATSGKVLSRELSGDEKSRYSESAAKELAVR